MSRTFTIYNRTKRPELKPIEWQKDWFEYQYKDVKKSTGPGEDDFKIETKEEIIYTNIAKHIASFKDDVGIRAIMKKVALTGDATLLDEKQTFVADLSGIPDEPQEKLKAYKNAQEAYGKIDPELRGSMTMEEFIKSMDAEKIGKYIDAKIAASQTKQAKTTEGDKQ